MFKTVGQEENRPSEISDQAHQWTVLNNQKCSQLKPPNSNSKSLCQHKLNINISYLKLEWELTFVMWKREGSNGCHATWQSKHDQDEVDLGSLGLFFASGLVNLILITFPHEISEAIVSIPLYFG